MQRGFDCRSRQDCTISVVRYTTPLETAVVWLVPWNSLLHVNSTTVQERSTAQSLTARIKYLMERAASCASCSGCFSFNLSEATAGGIAGGALDSKALGSGTGFVSTAFSAVFLRLFDFLRFSAEEESDEEDDDEDEEEDEERERDFELDELDSEASECLRLFSWFSPATTNSNSPQFEIVTLA